MKGSNRKYAWYWMVVLAIGLAALSACQKKTEVTAIPEAPQEQASVAEAAQKEETAQPEQKVEEAKPVAEEPMERAAAAPAGLQPVYFDLDRAFIRAEAGEIMKANAEWLKAHPQAKVRIEGNCDERGTVEYNQALGQRRAASAKEYLANMGISVDRVTLIAYGKEKPICTESTESCWQKNRRGDFVVVTE